MKHKQVSIKNLFKMNQNYEKINAVTFIRDICQ